MANNFLDELESELSEAPPRDALSEIEAELGAPPAEDDAPWWKRAANELVDPQAWKRALGVTARGAIQGVGSVLTMPADAGIGLRNALTGSNYEGTASMLDRELDALGLARPESRMEKANALVAGVLAGSRLPAPQAKDMAPAGFVKPPTQAEAIFAKGRKEGLVAPPTTVKPTSANRAAEGFSGKLTTAQQASQRNQPVFNMLAKRALGMSEADDITPSALQNIRQSAGKIYEQIADSGDILPDQQFLDDLAQLGRGADEISKAFPGANVGANKQIGEMVDSLLQDKFSSKAALQYLRELRKQARGNLSGMNAADPTKQALGMAQREAAATLEDLIGRHLEGIGKADVARSFADARRTIAMTHSVEDALNESTGNVIAAKLAKQMGKGKPLSGDLETIAQFAQAFPKASREIVESMPGVSPLDYAAAFGSAIVAKSPGPLAWLTMRPTMRSALLSDAWQKSLIDKPLPLRSNIGVAPSTAIQFAREDE